MLLLRTQPQAGTLQVFKVTETSTSITVGWSPPLNQEGYLPLIDGSPILTDGRRHPSTSTTRGTVKIGKKLDGSPHQYGVSVLVRGPTGSISG